MSDEKKLSEEMRGRAEERAMSPYTIETWADRVEELEGKLAEAEKTIRGVRPGADAYRRVCDSLGIGHDILGSHGPGKCVPVAEHKEVKEGEDAACVLLGEEARDALMWQEKYDALVVRVQGVQKRVCTFGNDTSYDWQQVRDMLAEALLEPDPEGQPPSPPAAYLSAWVVGDDIELSNGIIARGHINVPKDKAYLIDEMGITIDMEKGEGRFDPSIQPYVVSICGVINNISEPAEPEVFDRPDEPAPEADCPDNHCALVGRVRAIEVMPVLLPGSLKKLEARVAELEARQQNMDARLESHRQYITIHDDCVKALEKALDILRLNREQRLDLLEKQYNDTVGGEEFIAVRKKVEGLEAQAKGLEQGLALLGDTILKEPDVRRAPRAVTTP